MGKVALATARMRSWEAGKPAGLLDAQEEAFESRSFAHRCVYVTKNNWTYRQFRWLVEGDLNGDEDLACDFQMMNLDKSNNPV